MGKLIVKKGLGISDLIIYIILFSFSSTFIFYNNTDAEENSKTRVDIVGSRWFINGKVINVGSHAEGLLMNVRMVNAIFEDTNPKNAKHTSGFDPNENVENFIKMIPNYVFHGVRAFTISLQGGFPGYEGAFNSAFNSDGSLRSSYMARVHQVVEACDYHGAVVILSCFYQRQHFHNRALKGRRSILAAIENVAKLIKNNKYNNVVLEISNEYSHPGFRYWNDSDSLIFLKDILNKIGVPTGGSWLRSANGQIEMIKHIKKIVPSLMVSTSGVGDGKMDSEIAKYVDFILLHFNDTKIQDIDARIISARSNNKPVVCNEDNKLEGLGAEAARVSVNSGAGWGFMHIEKNQHMPFKFHGAEDDSVVYNAFKGLTAPVKFGDQESVKKYGKKRKST